MATEEGLMVCVIFREILGLSDGVRDRGCSVVRGKKRNFAVGSPKNSVDKRFVYFAKIGFRIRDF
jgi:hypothetical protein